MASFHCLALSAGIDLLVGHAFRFACSLVVPLPYYCDLVQYVFGPEIGLEKLAWPHYPGITDRAGNSPIETVTDWESFSSRGISLEGWEARRRTG